MADLAPDHILDEPLQVSTAEAVSRITLNRPSQRNPLSLAVMERLLETLEGLEAAGETRVLVIASTGPAFCAGHDLSEIDANPDEAFLQHLFTTCSTLMMRIQSLRFPVIAEVQGIATAAGCQLVATCDLALAGSSARFATPGVNLGLFCSTPMVALSRAVAPKHAMEMLLTGQVADAPEAARIGLINRVVPDEALRSETDALAAHIAGRSHGAIKIGKAAFYEQRPLPLKDAYAMTSQIMAENMSQPDAQEGLCAFLEKRAPKWRE
ncbi:MAG: enoyl-CoA hydratase [Pseudomonadota bacterium]